MEQKSILIVDDDLLNRKLLNACLAPGNYKTVMAQNGREALEKVKSDPPELVLLDVMMPGMSGYEVAEYLKKDPVTRDIPIILVTALDDMDSKVRGLESGADEFLNKPINNEELMARVESLLRMKQYRDEIRWRNGDEKALSKNPDESGKQIRDIRLPTILLVEDDEMDAQLIQMQLYGQPYRIVRVKDGEEAVSIAQQEKIDLILLDILLPKMNGFDVAAALKSKSDTRDIQILALTCLSEMKNKIRGIKLGIDEYLIKPINIHELRARISSLIKKKAYLDQLKNGDETGVDPMITDKLTGLYNHAYFLYTADREIKQSGRQRHNIGIIKIDIDNFKGFNEARGKLAGDGVLKELGNIISRSIRDVDIGARCGGQEFMIILPYSDENGALTAANRIRERFTREALIPGKDGILPITLSMGVVVYPEDGDETKTLIQNADHALKEAKRNGKDRICVFRAN
jgi:two-component system, cell cycle response regulator